MTWVHATAHVCAVDDNGTVHAMAAPLLQWTACTRDDVALAVGRVEGTEDRMTLRWPPRVATLPDGMTRCRECWGAVGDRELTDWPGEDGA